MAASQPQDFPLDTLSARERAVLDYAAQGMIDVQIAQKMDLSTSTVNSYWVRIRGKLGQHSRTELVARALRYETFTTTSDLRTENARLKAEMETGDERMQAMLGTQAALLDFEWRPQALVHLPHAALVVGPPANVRYANLWALRLYRADSEGLEGLAMRDLTTGQTPENLREPCREMLLLDGPETETHGLEDPYYARRRDGTGFRAVIHAQRFDTRSGPFVALSVREFLEDAEVALRALRQSPAA